MKQKTILVTHINTGVRENILLSYDPGHWAHTLTKTELNQLLTNEVVEVDGYLLEITGDLLE